jgi:hypothetical protein
MTRNFVIIVMVRNTRVLFETLASLYIRTDHGEFCEEVEEVEEVKRRGVEMKASSECS